VGGEGKPLDWTTGQFLLLSTEGFSDSSGSARSRRNGSSVLLVIPRLRVPQQPHINAPSVLMQNPTRRQLRRCERLHRKALNGGRGHGVRHYEADYRGPCRNRDGRTAKPNELAPGIAESNWIGSSINALNVTHLSKSLSLSHTNFRSIPGREFR